MQATVPLCWIALELSVSPRLLREGIEGDLLSIRSGETSSQPMSESSANLCAKSRAIVKPSDMSMFSPETTNHNGDNFMLCRIRRRHK